MRYRRDLTLDVSGKTAYKIITAKQGDNDTRYISAALTKDGSPLRVEEGVSAVFRCVKPDGHSCLNSAEVQSDGTVTAELTRQVLAVSGMTRCDISLIKDGAVLSTATFFLNVEPAPVNGNTAASSDEFGALADALKDAKDATDAANEALQRAEQFEWAYTVATDEEVRAMLEEVFTAA